MTSWDVIPTWTWLKSCCRPIVAGAAPEAAGTPGCTALDGTGCVGALAGDWEGRAVAAGGLAGTTGATGWA
jgi:hypothetical protein